MSFHTIDDGRGIFPQLEVCLDVTNAPTNPTRVWTDVTADVRRLSYAVGGRNDELQQSQPGNLNIVFSNGGSKYDPTNGSGIGIKRHQWIRVRAQWNSVVYPRWQGIITTIDQSWLEAGLDAVAQVAAADALKVAALFDLAGETFPSQFSSDRVAAVCAILGIPANIVDTGISSLIAVSTPFSLNSPASSHLTDVETTENGLVFADWNGAVTFQSRQYRSINQTTSVATIGDGPGEIPYRDDSHVVSDDQYLYNVVDVTPTNSDGSTGTTQTATNSGSKGSYFSSGYQRTILSSDESEALNCAEFLANKYGDPSPRIPAVELAVHRQTSMWPTVLAASNSTRFTFRRRAANSFSEDVFVEQVSEEVVPNTSWKTRFQLSPAPDQAMWILGDAVNGVLGSTTRPGY